MHGALRGAPLLGSGVATDDPLGQREFPIRAPGSTTESSTIYAGCADADAGAGAVVADVGVGAGIAVLAWRFGRRERRRRGSRRRTRCTARRGRKCHWRSGTRPGQGRSGSPCSTHRWAIPALRRSRRCRCRSHRCRSPPGDPAGRCSRRPGTRHGWDRSPPAHTARRHWWASEAHLPWPSHCSAVHGLESLVQGVPTGVKQVPSALHVLEQSGPPEHGSMPDGAHTPSAVHASAPLQKFPSSQNVIAGFSGLAGQSAEKPVQFLGRSQRP